MLNLQTMTCDELREKAKELNIVGRWKMTKSELISEIEKRMSTDESAANENEITESNDKSEVKDSNESVKANCIKYVENAEVGAIIAFKPNGQVNAKSAKIVKKSTAGRKFLVETNYGARYIVNYEDVMWVKTGKRWPKWVYDSLKGLMDCEKK